MAKLDRQGGPVKSEVKEEIKEYLRKLVENGNILGVSNTHLSRTISEQHNINVSRHTIANYLDEIYKNIPEKDIKKVEVRIDSMFQKIFRNLQEMMNNAETEEDRRKTIQLMLTSMEKFQNFLESFGVKPKPQENINVSADVSHGFQFNYIVPKDAEEEVENHEENGN